MSDAPVVEEIKVESDCSHEDITLHRRIVRQGNNFILHCGPVTCKTCGATFKFVVGKGKYAQTAAVPFGNNFQDSTTPEKTDPCDPSKGCPGTEMLLLTTELGIEDKPGCTCKGTAAMMDRLGVEGCRNRINELTLTVEANWASWGWKDKLEAASKAAWRAVGLGVNPTDPLRSLLELAIHRAEQKMVKPDA